MRAVVWSLLLFSWARMAAQTGVLSDFRPSSARSDNGAVSEVEFSTGLVELEAGTLAHHLPQTMKNFSFAERVWIIAYKTSIVDARGRVPKENYLCHTFFADQRVAQHDEREMSGIYSDAFTPEVRVPDGFGIPLAAGERLHWMPMFNNRGDEPTRVAMQVTLTLIRGKDLKRPLKPLQASLRSVQTPHLYFVAPGRDERQTTFTLPFNGRIHFLGTHLHPYGVSIELYSVTRGERVWIGKRRGDASGAMEVFSSSEGYPIRAGEQYRITAAYENVTRDRVDAMAGLFMLYSRE